MLGQVGGVWQESRCSQPEGLLLLIMYQAKTVHRGSSRYQPYSCCIGVTDIYGLTSARAQAGVSKDMLEQLRRTPSVPGLHGSRLTIC